MSTLFGKPKVAAPVLAPPPPAVDDAITRVNERDKEARGQVSRRATILTSEGGLPDLGRTTVIGS